MDPRQVTSVLSVLAVLLSLAYGYPRESGAEGTPLEHPTTASAPEDVNTSPVEKLGEKKESPDRPKSELPTSLGAKLKVRFPLEDSKQAVAMKDEDDDSVRSPRNSPSMSFGPGPHTTTVCIQVRSSQHPAVVCGPQVEDKKVDLPSARYAYPEYYARSTPQYASRYAQQLPPPAPTASPPAPIKIYPARRREDEVLKPVQQAPIRLLPALQPMVPPRQYYQPVMSAGLYPQSSQLLRLNCGVQPESVQLLNSPLLRSSSSMVMGYYPVGEQVVTLQDGSSVILGPSELDTLLPREQSPLRARSDEQTYLLNQESPYAYSTADPWASSAYLGEGSYYTMDMQGRSAGSGSDQQNSNYMGYPSEYSMDESSRSLLQEQELQQSKLRLRMLQNQLRELRQRSIAEEALKGSPASDTPQGHETSPLQEQKKDQATRTSKRQARAKEII